jgi:hypothetical protein
VSGPIGQLALFLGKSANAENGGDHRLTHVAVEPAEHVVEHRHPREELDDLEGARHPRVDAA